MYEINIFNQLTPIKTAQQSIDGTKHAETVQLGNRKKESKNIIPDCIKE